MRYCADLLETVLQWISATIATARRIGREMKLPSLVLGGGVGPPHRSPLQHDVFTQAWFEEAALGFRADATYFASMQGMDKLENLDRLRELSEAVARGAGRCRALPKEVGRRRDCGLIARLES